jgi:hypothetical protein
MDIGPLQDGIPERDAGKEAEIQVSESIAEISYEFIWLALPGT